MVVKTWGTPREEPELLNHVDLIAKLGIADLEKGTAVAGAMFSTSFDLMLVSISLACMHMNTTVDHANLWAADGQRGHT